MNVFEVATISLYGPQKYGIGHTVDGKSAIPENRSDLDGCYSISIQETLNFFNKIIETYVRVNDSNTGDRIRITISKEEGE